MGFATALNELGLPRNAFYTSLISFNIGIELAQIGIILLLFFGLIKILEKKSWYQNRIVFPTSMGIAAVAIYWTVVRIM